MKVPRKPGWQLPSSLKTAELHRIATLIGTPLTGTKSQVSSGIHDALNSINLENVTSGSDYDGSIRVLSIDMGIRNLAYAFLTAQIPRSKKETKPALHYFSKPVLQQWRRTSLIDAVPEMLAVEVEPSQEARTSTRAATKALVAESFEPPVLAAHAYRFAVYCAELKPTHILIERQRFRSGGQSAVQEWTLRVGMLESMLYATFHAMKAEKLRGMADTVIEPVLPLRVNKYWLRDHAGEIAAKGKQAKLAKIRKVSQMLEHLETEEAGFDVSTSIDQNVLDTFGLTQRQKAVIRKQGGCQGVEQTEKTLSKFDDMADSLLQGLAWLGWQENRLKLLEGGVEALATGD